MSDNSDEDIEIEEEPVFVQPVAPRRSTRVLGLKRQRDEQNPAAYAGRWDIKVQEVAHGMLNFFGTAVIQLKEGGTGQFRFERKLGEMKVRKELDPQGTQVEFVFFGVNVAEGDELNKEHAEYNGEGTMKVEGLNVTGTFVCGDETLHFQGSKSKLPFETIEIPGPEEEDDEEGWNI